MSKGFDKENYILKYSLFDGLPGFVKKAENTRKLVPKNNQTYLEGTTEMKATGLLGFLTKGFMRGATQNTLENMSEEVKYYIENGKPYPKVMSLIQ